MGMGNYHLLTKRWCDITHQSVGPRHDPYSRMTFAYHQEWEGDTQLHIEYVQCALAGDALYVNDKLLCDYADRHDSPAREEFKKLTGFDPDWLMQRWERNYQSKQEKYPCMACGSIWCSGRCVI